MADASGTTTWQYDGYGRLTKSTQTVTGSGTFVTEWGGFDPLDRPGWMKYPGGNASESGEQVTYTYGPNGALASVVGQDTYVQAATYDIAGRLELLGLGLSGGQPVLNVDYVYHPWTSNGGRLQQLKTGTPGDPTLRQDLRYTYDAVGNVLTIADHKAGGVQTQTFTYDELDRLKSAVAAGGSGGLYGPETYTYSATGNLLTKGSQTLTYPATTPGGCTSGTDSTKPHAVSAVTGGTTAYSYSYDCAGNATTRTVGSSTYTFTYNEENQLTAASGAATASFVYDGDGRRVKATVAGTTTVYIGDHYEWTGSTSTAKRYYYAGAQRVAMRTGTGTVQYLIGDHLGSTSLTLNNTGGLVAEIRYTAWGESRYTSGTTPTARHYTGQIEESGLGGLYFYNARWYEPGVGRFLQADTVVPGAGNPQALNRYSYSLSNPIRYTDPSGHWVESPLDAAFILWDIASIAYDAYDLTVNGPSDEGWRNLGINTTALAVDVGMLLLPGATGGGPALRAAAAGASVAQDVVRAEEALRLGQAAVKGVQVANQPGSNLVMSDSNNDPIRAIVAPTNRAGLRSNMNSAGQQAPTGMTNPQAHHDLPWVFREWFAGAGRGLNVNDARFGRWVSGSPSGPHQDWTRAYQARWAAFIQERPNATRQEVLDFLNETLSSGEFPSQ